MSARLVGWIPGSGRFDRTVAAEARLGATSDNEVPVPVDGVSRHHARISEESDGYWIEDAQSKNGTWVNGERATRQKLSHLDVITLGRFADLVFLARADEATAMAVAVRVRLEWLNGPAAGTIVDVAQGETILGRADSCGIIVDNGAISRAHARLTHTGDGVAIEDLGSANGTTVDGRIVSGAWPLDSGAEVELGGERRFRVLIDGQAAAKAQGASAPVSQAQDMEWMTRLVWSESDLEAVRAGLLAAGKGEPSKPRAAAPTPATGAATPSPPPPEAPAPAPSSGTVAETKLAQPVLGMPPVPAGAPPVDGTVIGEPEFEGPPPVPRADAPATSLDRTQLDGASPALPAGLQRPPMPGPSRRAPLQRPDLPPATVLGYRDVGPGMPRGVGASGASASHEVPSGAPDQVQGPIRAVRLSGNVGTFELPLGTVATIGRSEQATVRIDSRDVSRIHAVLTVSEQGVALEDKGSVNGTLLNGSPVLGTRPLGDGDRVAFGEFEFQVEFLRTEAKP